MKKKHLFLGRKAMTNLESILKSRDITLPTKVHLVKAMVFPVVMYACESYTIKITECQRIDAFELWCWRRLLRVPWTARRSSQSVLKEISPDYSLEELMLKLRLQYFGHLIQRTDSDAGKDWRQEEKGTTEDEMVERHHWLVGHEFENLQACHSPWSHKESDMTEWLNLNSQPSLWFYRSFSVWVCSLSLNTISFRWTEFMNIMDKQNCWVLVGFWVQM